MIFPSWVKNLVFFDLRFGFLVKNCIYGQILVKIDISQPRNARGVDIAVRVVDLQVFLTEI